MKKISMLAIMVTAFCANTGMAEDQNTDEVLRRERELNRRRDSLHKRDSKSESSAHKTPNWRTPQSRFGSHSPWSRFGESKQKAEAGRKPGHSFGSIRFGRSPLFPITLGPCVSAISRIGWVRIQGLEKCQHGRNRMTRKTTKTRRKE